MANEYNCVDVSEWNGDIDWNAAKEDDVKFAFIRCGFGQDSQSQDDKYFHINMEKAIEAGVKVGVYFYSYATNAEMAKGEAQHCLRLIEPYKDKIAFPVFYDLEEERVESHLEEIVPAFIDTLNEHGYNAGVYCTGYWYSKYFQPISCSYFWIAYWGSNDGQPHTKPEWCDVWQYTSKGSVHGIGYDSVDCDILYNEDMKLLIDEPEPTPEPDKKSVSIDMDIIQIGDKGNQVETLQILLNAFGYSDQDGNKLVVDSIFGSRTDYAVKVFQEKHDIEPDGIVGFLTWSALLK